EGFVGADLLRDDQAPQLPVRGLSLGGRIRQHHRVVSLGPLTISGAATYSRRNTAAAGGPAGCAVGQLLGDAYPQDSKGFTIVAAVLCATREEPRVRVCGVA